MQHDTLKIVHLALIIPLGRAHLIKIVAIQWENILEVNVNKLITIGSVLLVMKAQGMHELVLHGVLEQTMPIVIRCSLLCFQIK